MNPTYSHKDGNDLYPKYYYTDEAGNYVRYNNAPDGHDDNDGLYGDPAPYQEQLTMETAPQFFTPDGRRMTRAPFSGAQMQWNPNYHPNDPENLWAGRWVNPVTGEHEFAYIDADIRANQGFRIFMQNAQLDTRLPMFRQYVSALFKSRFLKDNMVAIALALLDQGRFRIRDLMTLRVGQVRVTKDLVYLGKRVVHGGPNLRMHLQSMINGRPPDQALWMLPTVNAMDEVDWSEIRRIGPHFMVNLMEELGVTPEALQTYHATQTYSMEMQRLYTTSDMPFENAHEFALLEVSSEMGHDLDHVEDYKAAIQAIASVAVDPIVVEAIKRNCVEAGLGMGQMIPDRPTFSSVPAVTMNLAGRTDEEEEFSYWLRMAAIHTYMGA